MAVSSGTGVVVTGSNRNQVSDPDPGLGYDIVGAVTLYLSGWDF